MSQDEQKSKCPICRKTIYEYRGLRSGRIRRPRDKRVPLREIADDESDEDY